MKFATALGQIADAALSIVAPSVARGWSEHPDYEIVTKEPPFEVRLYAPMLAASVTVTGSRSEATDEAFGILAGYIFGGDKTRDDIDMTVPVQQAHADGQTEMPPMIVGTSARTGDYSVRFMMPSRWTRETLPEPEDERIAIETLPSRRMAVVTFNGSSPDDEVTKREKVLTEFVTARGLQPKAQFEYAYYDPPFTLPALRRNEVLIEVA